MQGRWAETTRRSRVGHQRGLLYRRGESGPVYRGEGGSGAYLWNELQHDRRRLVAAAGQPRIVYPKER